MIDITKFTSINELHCKEAGKAMKVLLFVACISVASALNCKRCVDSDSSAFDTVMKGYGGFTIY